MSLTPGIVGAQRCNIGLLNGSLIPEREALRLNY